MPERHLGERQTAQERPLRRAGPGQLAAKLLKAILEPRRGSAEVQHHQRQGVEHVLELRVPNPVAARGLHGLSSYARLARRHRRLPQKQRGRDALVGVPTREHRLAQMIRTLRILDREFGFAEAEQHPRAPQ